LHLTASNIKMNIEKQLRSYNKEHSIKEVVFTLFFAQPVEELSLWEKLQERISSKGFEKLERLSAPKYTINSQNPAEIQAEDTVIAGLAWQKKNPNTSSLKQSIQIRNLEEQSFLSFHELAYERWANFKEDYLDVINEICSESLSNEIFVTGLNLTYIDEFEWLGDYPIQLETVFKQTSSYLPRYFFSSHFPSIDIAALINDDNSEFLTERIAIDIQKTFPNPTIVITHTIASSFENNETLVIFYKENLKLYLEKTHAFNKKTLTDLLTLEVQALINLPKEN
jgi:hypothetical protein